MKRRIAVFSSGWASQILSQYLEGLSHSLEGTETDTYLFLCYPTWTSSSEERQGEFNILRLPHIEDFDAVVILAGGLEFNDEIDYLVNRCRQSGKPVLSIGMQFEGMYSIRIDNAGGMRQLCEHLIKKHGIKKPFYMAGSRNNPDSRLRHEVLKQVMNENGLTLKDDDVYYTNWERECSTAFIDQWCSNGKEIPDAFICANDSIAMSVCMALRKNGYTIPDDVLVTGFDNTVEGQVFDPSIATVNQNYTESGFESGRLIMNILQGVSTEKEILVPCQFMEGESCCESAENASDLKRRALCCNIFAERSEDTVLIRRFNHFEKRLLEGSTYHEFLENLKDSFVYEFQGMLGIFHIILENDYEVSVSNPNVKMRTDGYSKNMQVALSLENGLYSRSEQFLSRDLIPARGDDGKNHLYVFLPLHKNNETYGYFVIGDCLERIESHFLLKAMERMNNTFERVHQKLCLDELNRKLTIINKTDSLTNVKNRMAWESKVKEIQSQIAAGKKPEFAIAMFDVNNLKIINDEYGHKAGDTYLINSSRLICQMFKQSPVYRIGGDEFLALLTDKAYVYRQQLQEMTEARLHQLREADVPELECVSFACGISAFNPDEDNSVEDVFRRADALMYKNKAVIKASR